MFHGFVEIKYKNKSILLRIFIIPHLSKLQAPLIIKKKKLVKQKKYKKLKIKF